MMQAIATSRGLALSGPGGVVFLSNRQLAAVAEFAIALQDLSQPDPDLESVGLEDDFEIPSMQLRFAANGAGCPVADPGGCEFDGCEEDDGL